MLNPIGGELSVVLLEPRAQPVLAVMTRLNQEGPLRGQVLGETQSGRTEVRIGDRVIAVQTETSLAPGSTFLARMVNGRLVLYVDLESAAYSVHQRAFDPGALDPSVEITVRSLERTLQEMGMAPDKTWLTLSRAVLAAGFPLSTGLLRSLRLAFGDVSESDFSAIALALQKGIPLTPRLLEHLNRILNSGGVLADLLGEIEGFRRRIEGKTYGPRLNAALERLTGRRGLLSGSPLDGELLKRGILQSGIFAEWRLFSGEDISGDLKEILAEIRRMVSEEMEKGVEDEELLRGLREVVSKALDSVSESQVRSLQDPRSPEVTRYIGIPFRFGDEDTHLSITIRRDAETVEDNPCFSVGFRFSLSELGESVGLLRQVGNHLQVSLYVEDPEGREEMSAHLDELRHAVAALGYATVGVRAVTRVQMDDELGRD
jgi:hypothetical protein